MRIHRLRLEAFGPFGGVVDLDLDRVCAAGLFLVQGPTGAGKTSILDAICFALYAAVPGSRPAGPTLRSDHAPPSAVPRVVLDFTAGGRRLRISRSPEHLRPKRRGSGLAKEPATVALEAYVGGRWVPRSTRADEVGEIVNDAVGMGLAQFSRVVVLPQGDFAAFLRSKPEDRRGLLERLFDVSTSAAAEEWLAEQRRAQTAAVAAARATVTTATARLADVLARLPDGDLPPDVAPLDSLPPEALPSILAVLADRISGAQAQSLVDHDQAVAADIAAGTAREQALARAEARRRGGLARRALEALDATASSAADDEQRLTAARSAVALRGELAAARRLGTTADHAQDRLAYADAMLRDVLGSAGGDQIPPHLLDRARSDADRLAALRTAAEETRRLAQDVAVQRRHLDALLAAEAEDPEAVERVAEELRQARRQLAQDEQAAAGLAGVRAALEETTRIQRLRRHLAATAAAAADARASVADARAVDLDARETLVELRERRLSGMAAELAENLADDTECPVCGSLDHPKPAERGAAVTAQEVSVAEQRASVTAEHLREATAALATLDARAAALTEQLGDNPLAEDQIATEQTRLRACLDEAEASAQRLPATTAALADAVARHDGAVAAAADRAREIAVATATLDALAARVTECSDVVAVGLRAHDSACPARCASAAALDRSTVADLDEVLDRHGVFLSRVEARAVAADAYAAARRAAQEARQVLDAALEDTDFADVEALTSAILPTADLTALAERVQQRAVRLATHRQTLAEPDVAAALETDVEDLDAVTQAAADARAAMLLARDRRSAIEACAREFGALRPVLEEAATDLGPATARLDAVTEMAELVAGTGASNAMRMRLTSFVLAARLERIVALANERLAVIGDGRYRLLHDDSLASHGRRSGLGLAVQDLWTGQRRATSTLSGGESFMASLALALGLAEAIREESGGHELQTLFVDEGFGTLDEGSLEQVMGVLDSLREGGRAVGVVSHVPDLRTRITHQVVIDKTPHGSTVRIEDGLRHDVA